ncbi:hypothetical protein [Streptomyces sp. NBC_00091]|uniref:hypothetical protein n=1 Tax=Streptomyces sp. NBC_00091 TaxID=2975648 RepID=UPI00225AB731|nr:hypothetical protein [Streptomyces sp. NBC_00091]MCX5380340.1 hypothetical protein [Streptomyces sp. NBC_00091]
MFKGHHQMVAEYEAAADRLTLPPGSSWAGVPKAEPDAVFETGVGVNTAQMQWLCSWETEWISQRGRDADREERALSQLMEFPSTSFYQKFLDDNGRTFYDEYLTKARLGDPEGFQEDISANCQGG